MSGWLTTCSYPPPLVALPMYVRHPFSYHYNNNYQYSVYYELSVVSSYAVYTIVSITSLRIISPLPSSIDWPFHEFSGIHVLFNSRLSLKKKEHTIYCHCLQCNLVDSIVSLPQTYSKRPVMKFVIMISIDIISNYIATFRLSWPSRRLASKRRCWSRSSYKTKST